MTERLRAHEIETLRDQLRTLPDRYGRASGMLTSRGATDDNSGRTSGKPDSRAPLNLAVVHLADKRRKPGWHGLDPATTQVVTRYGVLPSLEAWVRYVREHMTDDNVEHPPLTDRPTVASEAAWLLDTLAYTLTHDWAPHLAHDVGSLYRQLGGILGERPEYRPRCRVLGCGETDRRGVHHGTLLEPMDNATWYACRACGRNYTIAADLRALGQAQEAMPGPEVAQALGLSKHTIRSWASRGLLKHEGRDAKGRKTYDIDTVRRVAQRVRTR